MPENKIENLDHNENRVQEKHGSRPLVSQKLFNVSRKKRFETRKKRLEGEKFRLKGKFFILTESDEIFEFSSGRLITDPEEKADIAQAYKDHQEKIKNIGSTQSFFDYDDDPPDFMTLTGQNPIPHNISRLAEKRIRFDSQIFIIDPMSGTQFSGQAYRIGDKRYLYSADNEVYEVNDENHSLSPVTEISIGQEIKSLAEEDKLISQARDQICEIMTNDKILQEILKMHLEFTNGRVQPHEKNGIAFYMVGRNASHEFYAGVLEGRKYVYSVGEGINEEIDEEIREVQKWGYLGHL